MTTLTVHDRSRCDLYEITCTRWDGNGTLFVTVRETIGEREISPRRLAAMRRLARRAIDHPERTRSARTVRTWFAQGSSHATFAVSRVA